MPGPPPRKTGRDSYIPEGGPVSHAPSRRADIPIPDANPNWYPKVQSWFRSLKLSGQSAFYEASDWSTAVSAARAYDISIRTQNASWFTSFTRLSERLAVTIVDRQRARIELSDPEPTDADEDAAYSAVSHWQGHLGLVVNPPDPA